jgi:heptosyltransferase-2
MIEARPLIVRLRNFVGDAVLGVPALRLLERHGYRLELVGKGWARDLFAAEGWRVHVRPKSLGQRVAQLRALRKACLKLDPGFDQRANTLLLPWAFSAALDARLAGLRAEGYAHEARGWLLARSHPMRPGTHALVNYWELACAHLGIAAPPPAAIEMAVSPAQRQAADLLLRDRGVQGPFVMVCPFASGTVAFLDKCWPDFPEFVRRLKALGRQVVICPGPSEIEGAQQLYPDALRLEDVGLGLYNALLQRAALVVANDTGPAHMAAAVGARLFSVLGPTLPEAWGPVGPRVEILRRWPGWISVDEVLARVDEALSRA